MKGMFDGLPAAVANGGWQDLVAEAAPVLTPAQQERLRDGGTAGPHQPQLRAGGAADAGAAGGADRGAPGALQRDPGGDGGAHRDSLEGSSRSLSRRRRIPPQP